MNRHLISPDFYLSMIEFLLYSKHRMINIGNGFGLTAMQMFTLLLTDNANQYSMNNFCKLYACDASNVTGIIDGLEQKGLVTRRENPKDRRIKVIHLEPAGEKLKRQILQQFAAERDTNFAGLSDKEISQFAKLIQKLADSRRLASEAREKAS